MNFKETLKKYKDRLDVELEIFLSKKQKGLELSHPFVKQSVDNLKEYVLRGSAKRIRGALINVGYKAFSGEDNDEVLKISCGPELTHSYFLIHDDIIDRDETRRGGKSMHIIYKEVSEKENFRTKSLHFGNSIAIVVGDILSEFGYDAILNSSFLEERKVKALKCFNEMVVSTCYGQLLDITASEKKQVTEDEIIEIYRLKTARYTVEVPLQIGAILAGASDDQLKHLSDYALPVGIVFQLSNDLSEIFVDDDKSNEKTASDIKEGKQPLFIVKALESATKEQKEVLLGLSGRENITKEEIKELQKIIIETGALGYCKEFAQKQIIEAKEALKKLDLKDSYEFLTQLADYVIKDFS